MFYKFGLLYVFMKVIYMTQRLGHMVLQMLHVYKVEGKMYNLVLFET